MTPLTHQTCSEHIKLIREQTELTVLVRAYAEATRQSLDRILNLLQGQSGAGGLTDRVVKLETCLIQTDENIGRLVTAIEGKDGNGGLVGRIGKLERGWAMFIGVAVAGGTAGAGFAKLLTFLGG